MTSIYATPADIKILDNVTLFCYYANKYLEIQFPPKITSDSRKMNWSEHKSGYGVDPTAHFSGNSGREMTIKFEYVIETDADIEKLWSVRRIKKNVNLLKGIFTGFRNQQDAEEDAIGLIGDNGQVLINFRYPLITGHEAKTFRVSSVNVEYSDEIIGNIKTNVALQSIQGDQLVSYPLKTIVTMSMITYSLGLLQSANTDWEIASLFPSAEELWY